MAANRSPLRRLPSTGQAALTLALLAGTLGCGDASEPAGRQGASTLVHLADRLDAATIESAGSPESARLDRSWSFTGPQDDWSIFSADVVPQLASIGLEPLDDGVRLSLSRAPTSGFMLIGGLSIDLEGLVLSDWETVLVRARSSDRFAGITVAYNLDEEGSIPGPWAFFMSTDETPPVFNDGSEQVYAIPLRPREGSSEEEALESLGILLGAPESAVIDVLEISLVPRGASFPDDYGVHSIVRDSETRHSIFAHTPARLSYQVDVPRGGRLDMGLTTGAGERVTYRVAVTAAGSESHVLFDELVEGSGAWHQRSIDLSSYAGGRIQLTLEAESESEGAVAMWGAPILSRDATSKWPNVIFYIIDGAGADLMSVHGYDRPTTPFLEELAAEGAVFDHAYSNSTWTQPSTASFMTSLQHSVLGGLRRGVHSTAVPAAATTMAEHMGAGGYQTASFSSNPNAGRIIGIQRGVDLMRDGGTEHHSTSSVELHEAYWRFRDIYPGGPYWVHFQTSDVHEPNDPRPPFSERWVDAARRQQLGRWDQQLSASAGHLFGKTSIAGYYDAALELAGIDRQAYFSTRRDLYDETMTHQDHQLRLFVDRLKAEGEWENTLLIIASDHGHPAGTFARFGRGLFDPQPAPWQGALFDSYATHVPMMWIWPGHIAGGQHFDQQVSMIDVLPTLLDLIGLPQPEVLQGQSLAPLLEGGDMEVRPVIFDEFRVDEATGEMIGNIEIIDGRWGASLEIRPESDGGDPAKGRHSVPAGGRWGAVHPYFEDPPRLLLYDLEADPFAREAVNDEHPELVERYRRRLLIQWKAHLALARQFAGEIEDVPLTPDQLQQLKSLGYIQ